MKLALYLRQLSRLRAFLCKERCYFNREILARTRLRRVDNKSSVFLADQHSRLASTTAALQPISSASLPIDVRRKIHRQHLLRMSAQLAKPLTIYITPDIDSHKEEDGRGRFRLMFRFSVKEDNSTVEHFLNFNRDYDGYLKETLTRIRMKLASLQEKPGNKKTKKAKLFNNSSSDQTTADWNLRILTADGVELRDDVSNETAFITHGRTLVINDQRFDILGLTPSITKLEVAVIPMVGYPVLPSINVSDDGSISNCQYFWFTRDNNDPKNLSNILPDSMEIDCQHDEATGAVSIRQMKGWTLKSTDRIYVPDESDLGRAICLVVTPRDSNGRCGLARVWTPPPHKSGPYEMFEKGIVTATPTTMIWTERHRLCTDWTPPQTLRFISYNILADLYMNLTVPDADLYFPYCQRRFQTYHYRYPLILKEITGYHADLCCLQEVDVRNYDRFLDPYMRAQGYRGVFKRKGGLVNEGSAIFYRPEKLEFIGSHDEILSDLLSNDNDEFDDLIRVVNQNDALRNSFLARVAVAQVAVFESRNIPNSLVCVANTHLHFDPRHPYIRLLQAAVGYRHLLNVLSKMEKEFPNCTVAAIFAGDFNSTKSSAVYEMFEKKAVNGHHPDWQPQIVDGRENEADTSDDAVEPISLQGIDLTFSKRLRSACPSNEYTTCTHVFRGELDHVFISDELMVERVIPMPSHELVTKYVGLPSAICPSDHLAVICELRFAP